MLVRQDLEYRLPAYMSLLAATCYLIAAIGFAYRRRWTWWLSVVMLGFELAMVLIGGLSLVYPTIGRTVWRGVGADYGFFALPAAPRPHLALLARHPARLQCLGQRPAADRTAER